MSRIYFENDLATLYLGDCADVSVAYDLLVTDPPYGQEFVSGKAGGLFGPIHDDDKPDEVVMRIAKCLKGLRNNRHVYIFSGRLCLASLPLTKPAELIWDKDTIGMGDLSQPWAPQHETILFATYEPSKANRDKGYGNLAARMRKGSVLRSLRKNSGQVKNHPTEKPVDLLRQLIESSSVIGETVMDPFCGSGSTLVAAILEGRKAIGIEIDERYCEVAARRIEAASAAYMSLEVA